MSDFIVYYTSGCSFDNTGEKVVKDLNHSYPEMRGRIELQSSLVKGQLEVMYKGVCIFSKRISMLDGKYTDLFDKVEMVLDEEERH